MSIYLFVRVYLIQIYFAQIQFVEIYLNLIGPFVLVYFVLIYFCVNLYKNPLVNFQKPNSDYYCGDSIDEAKESFQIFWSVKRQN